MYDDEPQPSPAYPPAVDPRPLDAAGRGDSERPEAAGDPHRWWSRWLDWRDPRWRLAAAFVLVVAMSLALGLLAGTCFGGSPEPPLEGLGLGPLPVAEGAESAGEEHGVDPEQQAFAERREQELAARQAEPESGRSVPDFTDRLLVGELSGTWRLDLGSGRRGYDVSFGTDAVRKVHRQRFDVTLYDAAGKGLPPYYTVLDLPDGKLLAFLDPSGTFRLVLEDLRREPDGRLSWLGPGGARRYGRLLGAESPWTFGRERTPSPAADGDEPEPRRQDDEPARRAERPHLGMREAPPPVPAATEAALVEEVERHLDELAFGLMERDSERVFALWDGHPDRVTRAAIEGMLDRYSALRAWTRLLSLTVEATADGPQARFEVVVTVQGAPKGARNRRDVDLRDVRWRGRLALRDGRGVELDPFAD